MKLISNNLIKALFIFFILAFLYTSFADSFKKVEEISLSNLVERINSGEVQKIVVEDSELAVTLKDNKELKSKKESEAALSETLKNYGVSNEALGAVSIEVKHHSGILYWFGSLLPFLLPFLLIVGFFWFTARQVRQSSTQALSFGQSRARIIDPNNKKEKIMFKDVAGVKEAKEELLEIVDFLKSPKKF